MAATTETGSSRSFDDILAGCQEHIHWGVRLAFTAVFLFHGVDKLAAPAGFAEMMGLPIAVAILVALAETGAGVFVIVGGFQLDWATRLAGLLAAPVMIGAIAMVHWPRWSFAPAPDAGFPVGGMEFQVTLLAIAGYLIVKGNDV